MGQIKNEQTIVDITQLNNYEVIEKIKKEIKDLDLKKKNLIDERKQEGETINNFVTSINYWIDQNKKIETKMCDNQKQIDKLEKQKINKIKNFFISLFSFGRKNKNKKISQLIQVEKKDSELLKETSLNNEEKIKRLNSYYLKEKEKYENLIGSFNKTLEKENELLMKLMNLEKEQQQKTVEVNEQMVAQYEAEIFKLTEKICDLKNQLTSTSSDEGFNSKSTSTSFLDSDITSLKLKPQISKPAPFKKSDKPWEQTLRKYDYPSNNYKQKQKTTKALNNKF